MKMRFAVIVAVAFSAPTVLVSPDVMALSPGIQCVARYGSDQQHFEYYAGGISNTYSSAIAVRCPLDRADVAPGYTHAFVDTTVRVDDPGAGAGQVVSCTLYARDADSSLVDSETDATSVADNGLQDLYMGVSGAEHSGYYYINCDLPPSGKVWSYDDYES